MLLDNLTLLIHLISGYISGLFPAGELASLDKASEEGWPADIHIIGKDILRFHAVGIVRPSSTLYSKLKILIHSNRLAGCHTD